MTELQKDLLNYYIPEYYSVASQIEELSDYEINLIYNNLPDSIDELRDAICTELQWNILENLCSPFIKDWDIFYSQYEGEIMDYCWGGNSFISYNDNNHSYGLSRRTIVDICTELVSLDEEGKYSVNDEDVDFSKIVADLNNRYSVKFCEV